MQTKKSPNDNVNDSNAKRNASLDLDLTCSIILSAKFSMKYIYESKNDLRKKIPVVLLCKNMYLGFKDFSALFRLVLYGLIDSTSLKEVVVLRFVNPTAKKLL